MSNGIELMVGERQILMSLFSIGFRWISRDFDEELWVYDIKPEPNEYDGHYESVQNLLDGGLLTDSNYSPDWFSWLIEGKSENIEKLIKYNTINASSTTTMQEPRDRIKVHEEICNKLHEVYVAKNSDYGNSFVTVREEVDRAIIVRLMDKMERLKTLTRKGYEPKIQESIEDTLMDMANYAIMEVLEMRLTKEE